MSESDRPGDTPDEIASGSGDTGQENIRRMERRVLRNEKRGLVEDRMIRRPRARGKKVRGGAAGRFEHERMS